MKKELSLQQTIRAAREVFYKRIASDIKQHPELTYKTIAERNGCHENTVYAVAKQYGLRRTYKG